jgi:hypothetical protein
MSPITTIGQAIPAAMPTAIAVLVRERSRIRQLPNTTQPLTAAPTR